MSENESGNLPAKFLDDCERLTGLAVRTLERVLNDPKAPPAAAVSAANSVLDRAERAIERRERARLLEHGDVSIADIEALILQLVRKRAAQNAQDAQVIEERPHLPVSNQ